MAENVETDTASWVEVQVTSYFTLATTAVFLILFEVGRRSPKMGSVFDRRRAHAVKRTPPPLMNRLVEWLFCSTDPEYWEYSEMNHWKNVVQERKRQQNQRNKDKDHFRKEILSDNDGNDLEGARHGSQPRSLPHGKKNRSQTTNLLPPHILTPDVFVWEARRLPMSVADYAVSGDLTEEQLETYEQKLIQTENDDRDKFLEAQQQAYGRAVPSRFKYIGVRQRNSTFLTFWNRLCYCCYKPKPKPPGDHKEQSAHSLVTRGSAGSSHNTPRSSKISRVSSGRSILNRGLSPNMSMSQQLSQPPVSVSRHLKTQTESNKQRPLGIADVELLRCVGLDTYVMIRFLRWGFDCTFYPFLFACVTILPAYYTNPYEGNLTNGYFRFTINRLEPDSNRFWVAWGFAVLYYCFVLRRIWIEWETFISLRFDFLANGDVGRQQQNDAFQANSNNRHHEDRDVQIYLEQYRNSCLIEHVPESHRRDRELFEFFEASFPGQVKRAEILLNASCLTKLIQERQRYIERYENVYAKNFHEIRVYRENEEEHTNIGRCCCGLFCRSPDKPQEPKIPINKGAKCFCGKQKMVKVFPHFLSEIKRLNGEIEEEHRRIMVEKQKSEDGEDAKNFFSVGFELGSKFVTGAGTDLTCTTGFVEFTNLSVKQTAIQCNLTGTNDFMVTTSAPDPRDIIWENATVEQSLIDAKVLQCNALLLTGALFWSGVVTFITSISNLDRIEKWLPSWLIPAEGSLWDGLVQGYLPVIVLEFLMYFIPPILGLIAQNFIRFKTRSEVDKFVFVWHFVYRLANLLIIIISGSLYDMLTDGISSPSEIVKEIALNISKSSQFFLNNMIVAAGTENFFELVQLPKMITRFLAYQVITVEAKSKRALEKLEKAEQFQWGWVMPPFIFAFLVSAVYCTMVPVLLGACAIFFYIATKVYLHQALYVYVQPYEGGGKTLYFLNRTVFVILYISIIIFSAVLGLRNAPAQGTSAFFVLMIITIYMDKKVMNTFVKPSLTLALTNARIIDEENKKKEDRARRYAEYKAAKQKKNAQESSEHAPQRGGFSFKENSLRERKVEESSSKLPDNNKESFYLYRQPMLNRHEWEIKPKTYR